MSKLSWHNSLSHEERDRRWQLVRKYLRSKGADGLLALGGGIWYVDNGRFVQHQTLDRYLSGWAAGATVLFPLEGEPVLLGAPFATLIKWTDDSPAEERPWIKDVRVHASASAIVDALEEKGLKKGKVIAGNISQVGGASGPERWTSTVWGTGPLWSRIVGLLPDCQFEALGNDLLMLIMVKSDEEIAMVRRAAVAVEKAMAAVVKAVRVGASELDVYLAIIETLLRNGAIPSEPYITSGPATTTGAELWQHGAGSPRIFEAGDVVNCGNCVFAYVGGLEAQGQITVAIPPVSKENQECAKIARESYEAGLSALRPGRPFREVVDAMAVPAERAGAWGWYPNLHSMNPILLSGGPSEKSLLERDEYFKDYYEKYHDMPGPRRSGRFQGDLVLQPGMVFEFEPDACLGRNRVNVGGTVLVTKNGAEELNQVGTRMRLAGEI
jgi:Xaa-Pro aminopeptidase